MKEVTGYRKRILMQIRQVLARAGQIDNALDFGAGDGFFCSQIAASSAVRDITPIDVVEREHSLVEPQLYDGSRLPFEDGRFDLAYAIDVIHHCPDPLYAISELSRCTRGWLMLKDHNCQGTIGHLTLAVLDELGNRRFGIPSPGRYQRNWAWIHEIEASGFVRETLICPLRCHVGPLGIATNRLQFLGLWRRA